MTQALQKKTILVVDDNSDIRDFLVLALTTELSSHAVGATDGFQALKKAQTLTPDLFLFDYRLPYMSGEELYERLHAEETFQHIPVLFISAHTSVELRQGVYFLPKPFDLDQLLQTVQHILDGGRTNFLPSSPRQ